MSNPAEVLAVLAGHLPELHTHAVSGLWVFVSAARGELRPDSDIDVLVEFDRPVSLFEFARLRRRLQGLLGRPVDLADDIVTHPERLHAVDIGWVTRLKDLVGDVTVDLNSPLVDEEA